MSCPKLIRVLLFQLPSFLFAQTGVTHFLGARSEAVANAVTADDSLNAVFHNPAGLATASKTAIIASFQKLYAVKDMQSGALACIIPTPSNTFGLTLHHTGITNYAEHNIGISYAKKFFPKLTAGVRLNGSIFNAREYGSQFNFTFDIGLNTLIFKDLNIGFYIQNPIIKSLDNDLAPPSVFHLGAAYRLSDKVKILSSIEKHILYPAAFKMGLEYNVALNLALRCGFNTLPARMSFGIGFQWLKNWSIDCALTSHAVLGLTPSASVIYVFKKNT
jgi:hypothetical protein